MLSHDTSVLALTGGRITEEDQETCTYMYLAYLDYHEHRVVPHMLEFSSMQHCIDYIKLLHRIDVEDVVTWRVVRAKIERQCLRYADIEAWYEDLNVLVI